MATKGTSTRRPRKAATAGKTGSNSEPPAQAAEEESVAKTTAPADPATQSDADTGQGGQSPGQSVGEVFTKRELVSRVAEAAGVKRRVARPVVEAVLAELGRALSRGAQLNLRPLGRASVNRVREAANAEVMVVKLRRVRADLSAAEPGASEAGEEDGTPPLAEVAE